ncbi:MAG: CPBP family intramembrane metalloprotease [Chloroflexi bacterium]|nr:CPBP family intramembrane metalloprotease [Chloroflexota bacterium]
MTAFRRLATSFTGWPDYPASESDRQTLRVLGLVLPVRASVAILVMTLVVLFDFSRTAIPQEVQAVGRAAGALRYQAIERVILFGLVPSLVVLLAFRDRLGNYGLGPGAWRWGLGLAVTGSAVMTPIVVGIGANPQFSAYYGISNASVGDLLVTNVLDLVPTEFLFRGFLMFTLLRTIGPLGVVVAQLPFVFVHLGKPEIELFSTLFGGVVFGWLNWRTRSIWWSALAHVYILTLITAVAGVSAAAAA